MRNVSDKSSRDNQNAHFMFNQCGLMVFNSGVVPVKATEILYKDFRIEYSVVF